MIKLFTEHFVQKIDYGFSIKENQVLKNDIYLDTELCFKIGMKLAKLNINSSNINISKDICLYVSSIRFIDTKMNCYFNVAVCLKQ